MNQKIILISGGSGMIGRGITTSLESLNYKIRILTRHKQPTILQEQFLWDPYQGFMEAGALDGVYGVIHLAGASIGHQRWTKSIKEELIRSRIISTRFIIEKINSCTVSPKVFISASAIGIYGDRPNEIISESSDVVSSDFLSALCLDWESEVNNLKLDIRHAIVRIGLVLSPEDGILRESIKPAKFGLSPIFGTGTQIYSWIQIKDLVSMMVWIIQNEQANGIYNGVSNHPINQFTFAKSLALAYNSHFLSIHLPKWIMRLVVGEFSQSLFYSQHILPTRLNDQGFAMQFDYLDKALKDLIK